MEDQQPTTDPLARLPYFAALSSEERGRAMSRAVRRHVAAGEVLFVEGESVAGLYLLERGSVKLFKTSPDGKEQVLRYMGAGDSFNEVPVFDGGPNPVSAQAIEDGEVRVLSRASVLELMHATPAFAAAVVQTLAARLRHMVALVEDLSFRQVTARVARILLQTIEPSEGVGAGAGGRAHVTQREIAQMAGTSREVVARALKALEDSHAIHIDHGTIQITSEDTLRALG